MAMSANLDFFAAEADQRAVLDFLFSSTDVRVFESYSAYDADLREFRSTEELATTFALGTDPHGSGHAVLLQLWSPSVMRELTIERFALDPAHCNGHTFHIRQRLAAGKVPGRPVLAQALELARAGYALKPATQTPWQFELQPLSKKRRTNG